jgi:hypothetical protein
MDKITNRAKVFYCPPRCDCEDIERRLTELEKNQCEQCCDCDAIWRELERLDHATEISAVRTQMSATQAFRGLGVSVISIGPTYNYWGIGSLTSGSQWSSGTTYTLVTVAQFPELARYQGEATIGTAWVHWGSNTQPLPIYADATSIYLVIPNTINPSAGATLKFTMTLILTTNGA